MPLGSRVEVNSRQGDGESNQTEGNLPQVLPVLTGGALCRGREDANLSSLSEPTLWVLETLVTNGSLHSCFEDIILNGRYLRLNIGQ